jgi:hypothetical protein
MCVYFSILYRSCCCLMVQGPTNGRRHWASYTKTKLNSVALVRKRTIRASYTGNIINNKLNSLSVYTKWLSRDSLVSMVTELLAGRPKNWGSMPGKGRFFFLLQNVQAGFEDRKTKNVSCLCYVQNQPVQFGTELEIVLSVTSPSSADNCFVFFIPMQLVHRHRKLII